MGELQGRRLPDGNHYFDSEPGDYWKQDLGTEAKPDRFLWCIKDPLGNLGSLRTHTIEEHDDGTITVSPSILDGDPGGWHGYLKRGVWSDA